MAHVPAPPSFCPAPPCVPGSCGTWLLPLSAAPGHLRLEEAGQVPLRSLPSQIAARWGGGTSAVKSCLVSDLLPTTPALPGSAGKDSLASGCLGGPSVPQNSQTQALTSVQFRRVAAVQKGALPGTHA